jgi:hypothetical protein
MDSAEQIDRRLTTREARTLVMGFNAPPGTGDDRNRERFTIVADEKGGAAIRLKDRRTFVVFKSSLFMNLL